jgi:hypothetical protein
VIDVVVDPLIEEHAVEVVHNNVPAAVVDNVDVPLQLSTSATTGADGIGLMVRFQVTALSQPAALVQ